MAWYAVYQQSDGVLVSIGQTVASDSELSANGYAKAGPFDFDPRHPNYQWNPSTLTFDSIQVPRPPISVQAFFDRFTDAEFGGIVDARDNHSDPQVRLTIKTFFERLYATSEVNLDSQRVIDGLAYLEAQGLIATGRAAEIRA